MGYVAVPTLMFGTLGVVLVGVAIYFWRFYRKPQNRHPMEHQRERNIDEMRRGEKPEDR